MDPNPQSETSAELEKLGRLMSLRTLQELVRGLETVQQLGNGEVGVVYKESRAVVIKIQLSKSLSR